MKLMNSGIKQNCEVAMAAKKGSLDIWKFFGRQSIGRMECICHRR